MTSARRVVVLPGLDGTGWLQDDFRDALADVARVTVLTYPNDRFRSYAELADHVVPLLPRGEPWLLVGESFGGPLAIAIAARRPAGLAGLVLCATFAHYPVAPLRALAALTFLAPVHQVPIRLAALFLLGRWSTPENRASLRAALGGVPGSVFRKRLRAVLEVDVRDALARIDVPVLDVRAARDRLVPRRAGDAIATGCPHVRRVVVDGPHCLLETVADACAAAVRSLLESSG